MSYVLEFEISGLPRLPNQLLRGHWKARHGHTKLWKRKVWRECWHKRPDKPLEKAKVTITRISTKEPDFDGLAGAGKCLLDGLVEARILSDDKSQVVGQPTYLWEKGKRGEGKVRIKVEEI